MAELYTSPRLMGKKVLVSSTNVWNKLFPQLTSSRSITADGEIYSQLNQNGGEPLSQFNEYPCACKPERVWCSLCVRVHWLLVNPPVFVGSPTLRLQLCKEEQAPLPGWSHSCVGLGLLGQDTPQTFKNITFRCTVKAETDPEVYLYSREWSFTAASSVRCSEVL